MLSVELAELDAERYNAALGADVAAKSSEWYYYLTQDFRARHLILSSASVRKRACWPGGFRRNALNRKKSCAHGLTEESHSFSKSCFCFFCRGLLDLAFQF